MTLFLPASWLIFHLTTAISLNQTPMTFITHDKQQGIAALASGFKVEGIAL